MEQATVQQQETNIAPLVEKLNSLRQVLPSEQDIAIHFIYLNEQNTHNETIDQCMFSARKLFTT